MRTTDAHPTLRHLIDLHDGVLAGRRLAATQAHLATGCSHCDRRAARVDRVLSAIEEGALPRAPRPVVRSAEKLYAETHRSAGQGLADALDAVLLVDAGAGLAAVRAAAGEARRLLWLAGEYELDVSVVACAGGFDVIGQLLAAEDDPGRPLGGHVRALRRGRAVARADVRADGRFDLRGLRSGVYALAGSVDGQRFVVRELVLE